MQDERVILVTGGARRIGKVISDRLRHVGLTVAAHSRTIGSMAADLSDPDSVRSLFERVVSVYGRVDGIVNNAAVFGDVCSDLFSAVNVKAPCLLSEMLLDYTRANRRRAVVVNILDQRIASHADDPYTLSKKELASFTVNEAIRFAPEVRLCGVALGAVMVPEHSREKAGAKLLVEHPGPEAVAEAVLFLLNATFVTGQILYVDAGQHLMDSTHG